MVDLRDLYEFVRYIKRYEIDSQMIAVKIEIATIVKLSEYLDCAKMRFEAIN